jgi:hypothetical protein
MRETLDLLVQRRIPTFGVCLGLQGIVEYFGGALGVLGVPMHGKPSAVRVLPSRLLRGLPRRFTVGRYHSLYALRERLPAVLSVAAETEDDDIVDLDEELHPDDVEEALDVVLRERTAAAGLDDEEDDEDEPEQGEGGTKIVPRRENEFLCKSCFLVLPRHQLADEKRMICRDCA